jgi:hypothetical protein
MTMTTTFLMQAEQTMSDTQEETMTIDEILDRLNANMLKPLGSDHIKSVLETEGVEDTTGLVLSLLPTELYLTPGTKLKRPSQTLLSLKSMGVKIDEEELTEIVVDAPWATSRVYYSYADALSDMITFRMKQNISLNYSHDLIEDNIVSHSGGLLDTSLQFARYRTTLKIGMYEQVWEPEPIPHEQQVSELEPRDYLAWGREICARRAFLELEKLSDAELNAITWSRVQRPTTPPTPPPSSSSSSPQHAETPSVASAGSLVLFERLVQCFRQNEISLHEPVQALEELAQRAGITVHYDFEYQTLTIIVGLIQLQGHDTECNDGGPLTLTVRAPEPRYQRQSAKRKVADHLLQCIRDGVLHE